jgi:hypothetical protein
MQDSLETFSQELDAAAHPIGEDLRVKVEEAAMDKAYELDSVSSAVGNRDFGGAVHHLDLAIIDLQKMRRAITCFQDSITRKKAACDPKTLKPVK